jgi:AmmeMemoRadiSam system protein A
MNLPQIARKAIEFYFDNKKFEPDEKTKQKYREKKACFVTLTENDELRGCIGGLEARQELWKDVVENAVNAGFSDFRFFPLNKSELKKIKIEVSVLTEPKKLEFKNEKELLEKLNKSMGIILKKGFYTSTFLPQVWEELPDKIEFLEHLSIKAGLNKDAWKNAEIFYYNVEIFRE